MKAPKKKRVGRPTLPSGERKVAVEVTLRRDTIKYLRALAEGNLSKGIEQAATAHRFRLEQYHADNQRGSQS